MASSTFFMAPAQNFIQTTLNGAITDVATTITLNSTTNLKAPGYIVIDRVDSNGTSTPSSREVVSYTAISGSDLTGCTRGADGSTNRTHSDGAVVETAPTVGMWNSLATIVSTAIDGAGLIKSVLSPISIARVETPFIRATNALISVATVSVHLNLSNASVVGLGLSPVFSSPANYSGPTIAIGGILNAPRAATLKWVSAITRYCVSTGSVAFDFKVREASVFANATTCPAIAAGGTFVSTASIANVNINAGDRIQADIKSVGADGFVRDIVIQGGCN